MQAQSTESSMENHLEQMVEQLGLGSGFDQDNIADTMIEILGAKDDITSIAVLLSYIKFCINHNIQKDITVKIGHNRPPTAPMNFTLNDEILEDIYPGEVVEIN